MVKQLTGQEPDQVDQQFAGTLSLSRDGDQVKLVAERLDSIDYWEVDPAWDGNLFHSAMQAVRPRGKETISNQLRLPFTKGGLPICGRVIDIHGNIHQITL